jgi:hypothetical protein
MAPTNAVALAPHAPDERTDWRSEQLGGRNDLYFQNARPDPVLVFWVDNEGTAHSYHKLRQAEHFMQRTTAGHLFKVTDEKTNTLHYFIAPPKTGSAVIK